MYKISIAFHYVLEIGLYFNLLGDLKPLPKIRTQVNGSRVVSNCRPAAVPFAALGSDVEDPCWAPLKFRLQSCRFACAQTLQHLMSTRGPS